MTISRELRRGLRHSSFSKDIEKSFYTAMDDIKGDLVPLKELKLKVDNKEYELIPLMILFLNILGVKSKEINFDLIHFELAKRMREIDYTKPNVKVQLIGANVLNIINNFEDSGLLVDIHRTTEVARSLGIYNDDYGDCDVEGYLNGSIDELFDIVDLCDRLNNVYLSSLYGYALDLYSMFYVTKDITLPVIQLYLVLCSLEDEGKVYKMLKVFMEYYLRGNLSDSFDEETTYIGKVSGDIVKDLSDLDESYVAILNMLEFDKIKEDYVEYKGEFESEALDILNYFKMCELSCSVDSLHKVFLLKHTDDLRDLKNESNSKYKELYRANKSLNKKFTKLEGNLKAKTKEVEKLTKNLKVKIDNSKELVYKKEIEELKEKLRVSESKHHKALKRVSNLEDKINSLNNELSAIKLKERDTDSKPIDLVDVSKGYDELVLKSKDDVSIEEKIEKVRDLKLLVVGGHPSWFKRILKVFPNARHIDITTTSSNFIVPSSTECVVKMSKHLGHAYAFRLDSILKGVPSLYSPTNNINYIVDIVYKELFKKAKGY